MAEEQPQSSSAPKTGFMKFLDVATERFRVTSPTKQLEEEQSVEASPRSRTGSVIVLEDPQQHQRTGSDDGAQQDVIRLLKQCLAEAGKNEEELLEKVASLEKDVEFWKKESYSGITVTLEAISQSPQYKELKERLHEEQSKTEKLQTDLSKAQEQLKEQEMQLREQSGESSLEMEKLRTELAKAKQRIEELEEERDDVNTEMKNNEMIQQNLVDGLRKEKTDLAQQMQAAQVASKEASKVLEEERQAREKLQKELEEVKQKLEARERDVDASELVYLQKDRETLAAQLKDAKQELASLGRGSSRSQQGSVIEDDEATSPVSAPPTVSEDDTVFQQRFKLPLDELILSCHGAAVGPQHGHVWLSRRHLCFGGSAVKSFYDQKDLMIKLDTIVSLDRVGNGKLIILQQDENRVTISGLRLRDELVDQICGAIDDRVVPVLREGGKNEDRVADDFIIV